MWQQAKFIGERGGSNMLRQSAPSWAPPPPPKKNDVIVPEGADKATLLGIIDQTDTSIAELEQAIMDAKASLVTAKAFAVADRPKTLFQRVMEANKLAAATSHSVVPIIPRVAPVQPRDTVEIQQIMAKHQIMRDSMMHVMRQRLQEQRRERLPVGMLSKKEQERLVVIDYNRLVEEPAFYEETFNLQTPWTPDEIRTFLHMFLGAPKNFRRIAAAIDRKTVGDVIAFYYRHKKQLRIKELLRAQLKKRGRARQMFDEGSIMIGRAARPSILQPSRGDSGGQPSRNLPRAAAVAVAQPVPVVIEREKPASRRGRGHALSHWTNDEKQQFLVAYKKVGRNWKKLSELIPSKSLGQLKHYYAAVREALELDNIGPVLGKRRARESTEQPHAKVQTVVPTLPILPIPDTAGIVAAQQEVRTAIPAVSATPSRVESPESDSETLSVDESEAGDESDMESAPTPAVSEMSVQTPGPVALTDEPPSTSTVTPSTGPPFPVSSASLQGILSSNSAVASPPSYSTTLPPIQTLVTPVPYTPNIVADSAMTDIVPSSVPTAVKSRSPTHSPLPAKSPSPVTVAGTIPQDSAEVHTPVEAHVSAPDEQRPSALDEMDTSATAPMAPVEGREKTPEQRLESPAESPKVSALSTVPAPVADTAVSEATEPIVSDVADTISVADGEAQPEAPVSPKSPSPAEGVEELPAPQAEPNEPVAVLVENIDDHSTAMEHSSPVPTPVLEPAVDQPTTAPIESSSPAPLADASVLDSELTAVTPGSGEPVVEAESAVAQPTAIADENEKTISEEPSDEMEVSATTAAVEPVEPSVSDEPATDMDMSM